MRTCRCRRDDAGDGRTCGRGRDYGGDGRGFGLFGCYTHGNGWAVDRTIRERVERHAA